MISCPKCKRPVSGNARACGYCGMSLIQDYFSTDTKAAAQYPTTHTGSFITTILGIISGICVLTAATFQIYIVASSGTDAAYSVPDTLWWARTLSMVFFGMLFFIQQILLHGLRFSFFFDGIWLFISMTGLGITLQGCLYQQANAFYGVWGIAVLLGCGCALASVSCIIGILTNQKPVYSNLKKD